MGAVYRATDTKLNRDVAKKSFPTHAVTGYWPTSELARAIVPRLAELAPPQSSSRRTTSLVAPGRNTFCKVCTSTPS